MPSLHFLLSPDAEKTASPLSGTIEGAGKGEYLLLREVKPGILEPVDSVIPGQNGSFVFRTETPTPSFYVLSMGSDDFFTLLAAPGEKIKVTASRRLSRLSVRGERLGRHTGNG